MMGVLSIKEIDMKELLRKLKNKLSCGGCFKEGRIELQGDHMPTAGKPHDVRKVLIESGFAPETIATK
jgi:translation initiation factor 1